jgi:Flp pilus assembly protein TadG
MRSTLQRLAADRGGNVAIEFALALPILTVLLLGLLDLGRFSMQKSAMLQGAQEGANYGIQYPTDTSLTGASGTNTTAQNATGLTGVTATSSVFCECTAGQTPPATCGTPCPGGGSPKKYVSVTTTKAFSAALSVSSFRLGNWTMPTSVSATVTMICASSNC